MTRLVPTDTSVPGHAVRGGGSSSECSSCRRLGKASQIGPAVGQRLADSLERGTLDVVGEARLGTSTDPQWVVTGKSVQGSCVADILFDNGVLRDTSFGSSGVDVR
jgi:hypothetical protein